MGSVVRGGEVSWRGRFVRLVAAGSLVLASTLCFAAEALLVADTHVNSAMLAPSNDAVSSLNHASGYAAPLRFHLSTPAAGTTAANISRFISAPNASLSSYYLRDVVPYQGSSYSSLVAGDTGAAPRGQPVPIGTAGSGGAQTWSAEYSAPCSTYPQRSPKLSGRSTA